MTSGAPRVLVCGLAMAVAGSAAGQSFNVKVGYVEGKPAPSSTYGAGAVQPGYWNLVPSNLEGQAPVALRGLDGQLTGVMVDVQAEGSICGASITEEGAGGLTEADDIALLGTQLTGGCSPSIDFTGLEIGEYEVVTYAWTYFPYYTEQQHNEVFVLGSNDGPQMCGGPFFGTHFAGVTYTAHVVNAFAGEIKIRVRGPLPACAGVQLRKIGGGPIGRRVGSVNIDFDGADGENSPSSSYAGAGGPGAAGYWNGVDLLPDPQRDVNTVQLRDPSGALTDTVLRLKGEAQMVSIFGHDTDDYRRLQLDSWAFVHGGEVDNVMRFERLENGAYTVLTYGSYGGPDGAKIVVSVPGSSDPAQTIGDAWDVVTHEVGVTHSRHRVSVTNGELEVVTRLAQPYGGGVAGIQLLRSETPACPCDADGANGLQVADIFAFLRAWFANQPSADFDQQNGIQVADIFAFLRCWFGGC